MYIIWYQQNQPILFFGLVDAENFQYLKIYVHFLLFLITEVAQVVEIPLMVDKELFCIHGQ